VRSALLVIDVQRGLFEKSTPIYRGGQVLAAIDTLVERAHAAGAPVVYVQHCSERVLPRGSNEWQLHAALQPASGDLLVEKEHGNAFEATPLAGLLQERGVTQVVVAGLVTHGCVQATCLGAKVLGYAVVLAADAHSSYARDAAARIDDWNARLATEGVDVAPTAEIRFS
jgi:nicotinamidase-related amidase